jgi:hypothetical protein
MVLNTEAIEKTITQRIAAAGIRLRFDRVALRLLEGVKSALAQSLPEDQSIAFTVTAPIKLPAKTSVALQEWLRRLPTHGRETTINGNEIRARIINHTTSGMPRVIGFVHNAECNADFALDIAEASLRGR